MKLTKAQAKMYSLVKWDFYRKTGKEYIDFKNDVIKNNSAIIDFESLCGYCEKYNKPGYCYKVTIKNRKCPLLRLWKMSCYNGTSLYSKWTRARKPETRIKYAEQIYQDIKRS